MASRSVFTGHGLCLALSILLLMGASGCTAPSSPSSTVQVFTGSTPAASAMPTFDSKTFPTTSPAPCDQRVIRSVTFTKNSGATRLRITYKDTAGVVANKDGGATVILGRIDDVPIAKPTGLRMFFPLWSIGTGIYSNRTSFTLVGYADGVAQGSHTLSFIYDVQQPFGGGATFLCFVDSEPFMVEISETS